MLTIKLALRTIWKNPLHAIITFVCVTLSAALLASVCSFAASLVNLEKPGTTGYRTTFGMMTLLVVLVVVIAAVIIRSVFTVSFNERVNTLGLLSSVGMTNNGKAMLVLCETVIYGILGSSLGVFIGRLLSEKYIEIINEEMQIYYRNLYGHYYGTDIAIRTFEFVPGTELLFLSFFVSLSATIFAAIKPMIRANRLTIINSLKADVSVNVSLRDGFFEKIINERFGRLGRLAAQNFDNHGPRYRAVSMALSASTVLFIAIYSLFMWGLWEDGVYNPFEQPMMIVMMSLGFALTFIALIGATGSAMTNINSRVREFAILKSLGMSNADLFRMMCFESILIIAHTAMYGFTGSMIAVAAEYTIGVMEGESIMFHFPIVVWLIFLAIDILFCVFFAVYSIQKIKKVNIAETIK